MEDLISIIVPCYNVAQFLNDFLLSIKEINYPNYEVILVDDGSTDETGKMLDEFSNNYTFARVIHQANSGVGVARNRGLKEAKGKYITFADPDDYVHPNIISELHRAIISNNVDVSSCGYKLVKENSHYRANYKKCKKANINFVDNKDDSMSHLLALVSLTIWNRLFKREILERIQGYPNLFDSSCKHGDDILFCLLYYSHVNTYAYIKTKLYYWRMRKTSITHKGVKNDDTNFFVTEKFLKSLNKDVYKKSQTYMHASFCLTDMGILNAIAHSPNYHNPEFARLVYKKYCEELPYVRKAKLYPLQYRFGTMFTKPFMYLMIRKKMKG